MTEICLVGYHAVHRKMVVNQHRLVEGGRMTSNNNQSDNGASERIVAEARARQAEREKTYREQALKLFPWVCARCGREFSGKKLRELTVHHKDHDHDHNPPDGSNWELLCLYCHDNEHARDQVAEGYAPAAAGDQAESTTTYRPFAGLDDLLKDKK